MSYVFRKCAIWRRKRRTHRRGKPQITEFLFSWGDREHKQNAERCVKSEWLCLCFSWQSQGQRQTKPAKDKPNLCSSILWRPDPDRYPYYLKRTALNSAPSMCQYRDLQAAQPTTWDAFPQIYRHNIIWLLGRIYRYLVAVEVIGTVGTQKRWASGSSYCLRGSHPKFYNNSIANIPKTRSTAELWRNAVFKVCFGKVHTHIQIFLKRFH